jgi:hypothetical protein
MVFRNLSLRRNNTANPRQVVLCLLDVARIAYVKHGFTEAPGLVKFEQEIDKELQANKTLFSDNDENILRTPIGIQARTYQRAGDKQSDDFYNDAPSKTGRPSERMIDSLNVPIDATDKLVIRYCRHKEEEAARKKNEELAAAASTSDAESNIDSPSKGQLPAIQDESLEVGNIQQSSSDQRDENSSELASSADKTPSLEKQATPKQNSPMQHDSDSVIEICDEYSAIVSSTTCDSKTHNAKNLADTGRIDSLDSGEGPTESASTGHSSSRLLAENLASARKFNTPSTNHTSIPVPMKRTIYTPSQISHQTESSINSELSSSRSSLLSNQDCNSNSNYERQATSDLDGKVMRIAKSYYGKKATKDVTRLSEGKYKIADRIVFVRLLKGHRVMVRIGGGWDSLENFLFRHKSDPSQVIDPDNLLPLETKMPFDKTPQPTPTKTPSKLPYYRLSNSASSNNLSLSNLSISNHSLVNSTSRIANYSRGRSGDAISKSEQSSPLIDNRVKASNLLQQLSVHKSQTNVAGNHLATPDHVSSSQSISQRNRNPQTIVAHNGSTVSNIKRPFYYQKTTTPNSASKHNHQQPLASSMTPTASATNIHLFDSPARSQATRRDRGPNRKLLLK